MNPKRFRWWGTPDEDLPEPGDVLTKVNSEPEEYLLVHSTAQVRGRPPHDLWLVVTHHRLEPPHWGIPEDVCAALDGGGRAIPYVPRRRGRH